MIGPIARRIETMYINLMPDRHAQTMKGVNRYDKRRSG